VRLIPSLMHVAGFQPVVLPESIIPRRPSTPFKLLVTIAHAPCSTSQIRRIIWPAIACLHCRKAVIIASSCDLTRPVVRRHRDINQHNWHEPLPKSEVLAGAVYGHSARAARGSPCWTTLKRTVACDRSWPGLPVHGRARQLTLACRGQMLRKSASQLGLGLTLPARCPCADQTSSSRCALSAACSGPG
jgi:hypothetical protein